MQFGADCFVADEDELEEIKKKVLERKDHGSALRPPDLWELQVRFYEYGQQGVVPPEWEEFLPPERE